MSQPLWTLRLLLIALATWAASAAYTLWLNPEVQFFARAHQLKEAWLGELQRANPGPKILLGGGSSCTTSADPVALSDLPGLRVANQGLGAGMGARVLAAYALHRATRGDTVILSIEPDLLTAEIDLEPLGTQFSLAVGAPDLLRQGTWIDWPAALLDLRPGGYHLITLFWKAVLRQPLYRYAQDELQHGGWHAVAARRPVAGPPVLAPKLSTAAREFLMETRQAATARGVEILYSVPWGYCPADHLDDYRRGLAGFLAEVSEVMPVLRDDAFGADSALERFADTPWHPRPEAVRQRTPGLSTRLRDLPLWRTEDLRRLAD